ncbi:MULTISPECIES: hypothetical protein [unclassified Microbacterium]|uniref:hypothetical protein n=1 Tax=unclassified Microbacterium TaxID=2609290 RepID=UPI0031395A33
MTLLMYTVWQDAAEIVSDTLVTAADGRTPVRYQSKVWAIPRLNLAMATTGTAEIGAALHAQLNADLAIVDVEGANATAPGRLRAIERELISIAGDIGSTTVYLFGFPHESELLSAFKYTSMDGGTFESQRIPAGEFAVKPKPQTFTLSSAPDAREEKIALACRVRDEQLDLMEAGAKAVAIGGELMAFLVENGSVQAERLFRFPDYDEALAMRGDLRETPQPAAPVTSRSTAADVAVERLWLGSAT